MRHARPFLFCLAVVFALFATACSNSDIKAQLQQKYDAMDDAARAKDVDKSVAPMASDFQQRLLGQPSMNLATFKDMAGQNFRTAVSIESKSTVESAVANGDRADVVVDVNQTIVSKDPTSDKKTHTDEITSSMKDTWKKVNDQWMLVESAETSHTHIRDGVKVPQT